MLLTDLYGENITAGMLPRFEALLAQHASPSAASSRWDERDAWLIAYPDQIRSNERSPLATLHEFFLDNAVPAFNGIHVLPFFPSTSDEGFSISDYTSVTPDFGTWDDIEAIGVDSRLMVDAVINHCSAGSECFRRWREGDPAFRDFFRTADEDADISRTVRAREHPLLTPFTTSRGREWVWTTFSPDQADLNYGNPDVLLFILSILLSYAERGASAIRIDAACFLWKQEGTTSIHLPQTHRIIQFLRACLDETYPDVIVVSETNVPHDENISYLGDGSTPEADMVYRFTLPPLTLHAIVTGQSDDLKRWLDTANGIPPGTAYLNFLASHDGVGVRPLEGLVDTADVERLVFESERHGGRVSRKRNADGTPSPYELNATWYDLIRGATSGDDAMARHLASHAIMFATAGVPAVYIHALLASPNDVKLMEETGSARSINRTRFRAEPLNRILADPASRASRSLGAIQEMLTWRRSTPAFHPDAAQRVLDTPPGVVGIERGGTSGERARVYVNVTGATVEFWDRSQMQPHGYRFRDAGDRYALGPWGTLWLIDR